ncbi:MULTISPECIES: histidine phosphotransferase family protein [unclassified Meridianimarinicoccus]|uniref:histidine phosphotransferase family protein n=1 Tax=unclassified Meridianimarinicoccus TaxID=2923344 RepID=UPI001866A2D2|nr:histidine phosphotransferase family protein [Fluviibacterium sp. MJW13]
MNARPKNLEALLGSRICHDLISPIGAIGNGLELMALTQAADGPEMAMISESVASAQARIRFYRVAYGANSADQTLGRQEIVEILGSLYTGNRLKVTWGVDGDVPRDAAKLAFLLLQCLETALPRGGAITVSGNGADWVLRAVSEKLRIDPDLWALLTGAEPVGEIAPSQIQFILAPLQIADIGRRLSVAQDDTSVTLRF